MSEREKIISVIKTESFHKAITDLLSNDKRVGIRKITAKDGTERIEVIEENVNVVSKIILD